jgi:hypothetical protein
MTHCLLALRNFCCCLHAAAAAAAAITLLPLLLCSASGKTTVCDKIIQRLHDQCVVMLNQDSFYRSLTEVTHVIVTCYCQQHNNIKHGGWSARWHVLTAVLPSLLCAKLYGAPMWRMAHHCERWLGSLQPAPLGISAAVHCQSAQLLCQHYAQ